jgi:hypothetical protein
MELANSAVILSATIAFGFVYMHPFEDGNGRIHRFLIHNILAKRGFTPPGAIFPVSAAMLQDKEAYDAALENFSVPLLPFFQYKLDHQGRRTVQRDRTALPLYRHDGTDRAFRFVRACPKSTRRTHSAEFTMQPSSLRAIVDMPDRLIDRSSACVQNKASSPAAKRKNHSPCSPMGSRANAAGHQKSHLVE